MIQQNKVFSVLGGDLRQICVAKSLFMDGYHVQLYAFDQYDGDLDGIMCTSLEEALNGADYVILPLPYSRDGIFLNAPYSKQKVQLEQIYTHIMPWMMVLGGKIDMEQLHAHNIRGFDYYKREQLQVMNAAVTAEGAIQIAMEESSITIGGSKCLIIGYGRIGKILSQLLKGLKAEVTVTARKSEDLAWISANGLSGYKTAEIRDIIEKYDFVFNTVPVQVIGEEELKNINKECLLIDLASAPGGIDMQYARECGVQTVWSLSLPGKVAPMTAGEIIKKTVVDIIQENQS